MSPVRPGLEEARRERLELRAVLVDALGLLPTDHVHMIGEVRVRLADASKWEAMCDKAAELTMEARAEATRWRARCPVTAEDVKAAGVTREQSEAWRSSCSPSFKRRIHEGRAWKLCNIASEEYGRPAFDILDEMAAMKDPS